MENQHRYEVQAFRRVRVRIAGDSAYMLDEKAESFPFGSGKIFKTGHLAWEAAISRAHHLRPDSSMVYVIKWNGNRGVATVIKESQEKFESKWDGTLVTFNS